MRTMFSLIVLLSIWGMADGVMAHGMSAVEQQAIIEAGNLGYLSLGATHMLSGYDHLMFVFGIIFSLRRLLDIVKVVTLFTLGHSITLVGATLGGYLVNYYLIDAVIALSVSYIAFANLGGFRRWLGVESPNLMWMILLLGLIHGLGLSARLQQLPLNQEALLANILFFNVGIEVGQLIALLLMVLLLSLWRKRGEAGLFERLSNGGLIVAGVLLFLLQMHGYLHQVDVDEFGFSEDLHRHAHESMEGVSGQVKYIEQDGVMVQNLAAGLDRNAIVEQVQMLLPRWIEQGKVAQAWHGAHLAAVEQQHYDGEVEWLVTLEKRDDISLVKSKLLLVVDFDGEFVGARSVAQ